MFSCCVTEKETTSDGTYEPENTTRQSTEWCGREKTAITGDATRGCWCHQGYWCVAQCPHMHAQQSCVLQVRQGASVNERKE